MNMFSEKFKNLSNKELFEIIENKDKYQVLAVETAKLEIQSRNLTQKEINEIKSEIEKDKRKKIENQKNEIIVKKNINEFINIFNPISYNKFSTEKILNFIIVIYGIIAMYLFYDKFYFLKFLFIDSFKKWDWTIILYLFPFIILPTSLIFLWKKKKIGWILFVIYLTFSLINFIGYLYISFLERKYRLPFQDKLTNISPKIYITFTLIFIGATLYTMSSSKIREIFNISKETMWKTIVITSIIYVISIYLIFMI